MIEKLLLNRTHDWSRTGSLRTGLYSLSNSPAVCIILQLIEMMIHCWSRIASLQSVATVLTVLHAAKFLSYWKIKKHFLSSQPYLVRFTVVKVDGRSKMSGRFCSITSTMTELKTTVHFGSSTHFFNYRVFCYFYPNFSIYSSCIHFCPSLTISILTFASLLFLAILLEIFLRSLLNPQHFLRLSSGGTQATSFSQADTREPP